MKTVTVSADALRQLLVAANGPPHYMRELQVLRDPPFGDDNPINILVKEFNVAAKADEDNKAAEVDVDESKVKDLMEDRERLRHVYTKTMKALVVPFHSFEEWLEAVDRERKKGKSHVGLDQ